MRAFLVMALSLAATFSVEAKGDNRAACMAQAGFYEADWMAHRVSQSKALIYRECMAKKGEKIIVHRRDGSVVP